MKTQISIATNVATQSIPTKRRLSAWTLAALTLLLLVSTTAMRAQSPDLSSPANGTVIIPESSVVRPEDAGISVHTNTQIFIPAGQNQAFTSSLPNGETPASIACVYQLVLGPYPAGCKKSGSGAATRLPTGGSGVIAIVDACDAPNIVSDLTAFSTTFGLPVPTSSTFHKVEVGAFVAPYCPSIGWAQEETLDVECAHAMAPNADIVLVEAASPLYPDMLQAEDVATGIIAFNGGSLFGGGYCPSRFNTGCQGQISNSWASVEFSGQTSYDHHFYIGDVPVCNGGTCDLLLHGPVTYFAAAGDKPGVSYPSAAPSVVSAGGTTINRDSLGNFLYESAWRLTGGGASAYEPLPPYQGYLSAVQFAGSLTKRATPDLGCVADPSSGVDVYFSYPGSGAGWLIFGGTSVCTPVLAGIVNSASNFLNEASFFNEHSLLYAEYQGAFSYPSEFTDVSRGTCGPPFPPAPGGYTAGVGYDFCTGIGSPKTLIGK